MTTAELPGIATSVPAHEGRVRVRVWDLVVRITHWLIALSIVILTATGLYIGHPMIEVPGPAGQSFVMGTAKVVHFYAAIVFTLAVLTRLAWLFLGNRYASWRALLPVTRKQLRGVFETLQFYLFLRKAPPAGVGHNPLAGLAYAGVFGLYLLMITTGLALYAQSAHVDSPLKAFEFLLVIFGHAQTARWIHHVATWVLVLFVIQHVYSSVLTAVVEKNGTIDSIFSGNKWVPADETEDEDPPGGKRA